MRVFLCFLLFTSFTWSSPVQDALPRELEKKVTRVMKSLFGKEAVNIEAASFPNISVTVPNRYFFNITQLDQQIGSMVISKAHGCHLGGCDAIVQDENAKYEDFWYAVVFDLSYQILRVKVLDYQSDYGYEICAKNWLKQFEGYRGCELEYGSKAVDAISGATVSAQSIVSDISNICWLLRED